MAMSGLEHAKMLIKAKRYDEARAVLIPLISTHATARQWLARLDEIAPVPDHNPPPLPNILDDGKPRKKQSSRLGYWIVGTVIAILLVVVVSNAWFIFNALSGLS